MDNREAIQLLNDVIFFLDIPVDPKPDPKPEPNLNSPKTHTIWVPKFTGKEKTTRFTKLNPQFVMNGGMFGYPKNGPSNRYVYNTKYLNNGRSFAWFYPGLDGTYRITEHYRATRNRSKRMPDIRLKRPFAGTVKALFGPVQYQKESAYRSHTFTFDLKEDDYIEIMPGDGGVISFGRMEFKRV